MLQLIRNNSPYTVIVLLIFTLIVKMQALMHPMLPVIPADNALYHFIFNIFNAVLNGSAFGFTMLASLMLFAQSLYLTGIIQRHRMFARVTYIPAFLYLLFSSLHPSLSYFGVPLLLNWFLLVGMDFCLTFHQTNQPRKQVFNAGFMLCIAAILHLPAALYLLLLFLTLLLLRTFNLGEWVVGLMGYLTPVYFYAAILFLTDTPYSFRHWSQKLSIQFSKIDHPIYAAGLITGLIILFLMGIYVLQGQMAKSSVFARRSWVVVIACFFISAIVGIITPATMMNIWLVAMPALSLIISHVLYLEKSKRFSNFAFYFSLLLVIFCQVALNR